MRELNDEEVSEVAGGGVLGFVLGAFVGASIGVATGGSGLAAIAVCSSLGDLLEDHLRRSH